MCMKMKLLPNYINRYYENTYIYYKIKVKGK